MPNVGRKKYPEPIAWISLSQILLMIKGVSEVSHKIITKIKGHYIQHVVNVLLVNYCVRFQGVGL